MTEFRRLCFDTGGAYEQSLAAGEALGYQAAEVDKTFGAKAMRVLRKVHGDRTFILSAMIMDVAEPAPMTISTCSLSVQDSKGAVVTLSIMRSGDAP
ncbi:MAG: hypothetical protein JWR84_883 [Caulobacter sp.]|nr:hypothetical protein [Caulobacter sp.]